MVASAAIAAALALAAILAACGEPAPVANGPTRGSPQVVENPGWQGDTLAAGPRAIFREREVDFGPVALDVFIEYRFTLRNAGDRPLVVVDRPFAAVLDGC